MYTYEFTNHKLNLKVNRTVVIDTYSFAESVAASKSSLESQSNQTQLKPQQQTGQKKPRNRNRRKGSGSNPLYNTDTSNPNKRTTPQLKLIGEEEFC